MLGPQGWRVGGKWRYGHPRVCRCGLHGAARYEWGQRGIGLKRRGSLRDHQMWGDAIGPGLRGGSHSVGEKTIRGGGLLEGQVGREGGRGPSPMTRAMYCGKTIERGLVQVA